MNPILSKSKNAIDYHWNEINIIHNNELQNVKLKKCEWNNDDIDNNNPTNPTNNTHIKMNQTNKKKKIKSNQCNQSNQ